MLRRGKIDSDHPSVVDGFTSKHPIMGRFDSYGGHGIGATADPTALLNQIVEEWPRKFFFAFTLL